MKLSALARQAIYDWVGFMTEPEVFKAAEESRSRWLNGVNLFKNDSMDASEIVKCACRCGRSPEHGRASSLHGGVDATPAPHSVPVQGTQVPPDTGRRVGV